MEARAATSTVASLLANGTFEGTASPWMFSGSAFYATAGSAPHSGTGYALLGTSTASSGIVTQNIVLPVSRPQKLSFALNVTTTETATTPVDKLYVELRPSNGALLASIALFSNLDKTSFGSYAIKGPYDLGKYSGQIAKLQFRVVNDRATRTTFRIDSVKVE